MTSKIKTFLSLVDLPSYESVELELNKIGLLRWVLGTVVFVRMAQIYDTYCTFSSGTIPQVVANHMAVLFSAIALFTIGFFTQLATICVAVGVPLADAFFGTSTLGTDVLAGVLLMFFLVNSGQFYSVDRLILRSDWRCARALAPFLRFVGAANLWDVRSAYLLALFFYALISFVALLFHVQDPHWLQGLTTKSLLLSSYLTKFYWVFRSVDVAFPWVLGVVSVVAGVGQSVFQLLMIPLMFSRAGRYFVCTWGMVFILVSLINMNLSYLPHVELVLWIAIFCPVRSFDKKIEVFFDDSCRLCSRTMKFLRALNYNSRIVFAPLSSNLEKLESVGVSEERALRSLYGLVSGRVLEGYSLYLAIAKGNVLLWPLVPVLLVGYVGGIGPRAYQIIAEQRSRKSRDCLLQPGNRRQPLVSPDLACCGFFGPYIKSLVYITFGIYAVVFLLVSLPPWNRATSFLVGPERFFKISSHLNLVGFEAPNVFNKADLLMSNLWLELQAREGDSWRLVPITSPEGSRLTYSGFDWLLFSNHNSDFLYFAHLSPFRRSFSQLTDGYAAQFAKNATGYKTVAFRVRYDYRKQGRSGKVVYRALLHRNRAEQITLWGGASTFLNSEVVFQQDFSFDPQEGLVPITQPSAP